MWFFLHTEISLDDFVKLYPRTDSGPTKLVDGEFAHLDCGFQFIESTK